MSEKFGEKSQKDRVLTASKTMWILTSFTVRDNISQLAEKYM